MGTAYAHIVSTTYILVIILSAQHSFSSLSGQFLKA